jgi:hypothetical protein
MDAIIAEFSCIERPTTYNDEKPSSGDIGTTFNVPIRVWTSDGVTPAGAAFAHVMVSDRLERRPGGPCPQHGSALPERVEPPVPGE